MPGKLYLVIFLFFVQGPAFSQSVDTARLFALTDSLIAENRNKVQEQSFDDALATIQLAENLTKDILPETYARCLYNHGRTYLYAEKPAEAVPYFQQAIDIQQNTPGKITSDYAYSITGLGNAFRSLGRYEEASTLYQESKSIRGQIYGPEHPSYEAALNNLAVLSWEMGNFARAEALFLECKNILENTVGKESPQFAENLSNLGVLYSDMGMHDKAEKHYLECHSIRQKTLGKDHSDNAALLHYLALLYINMDQPENARPLLEESLDILEKAFGKENHTYAAVLGSKAELLTLTGQLEQAKNILTEVVRIRQKIARELDSDYAFSLYNLGEMHRIMGDFSKAENLILKSKSLLESTFGKEHPQYTAILDGLAETYELQHDWTRSEEILKEGKHLKQKTLNKALSFLSEKELSEYSKLFERDLERMLNIIHHRKGKSKQIGDLESTCFDNILFYKGYLLTAARRINASNTSDPELNELKNKLKAVQRLLSREYASPLVYRDSNQILQLEEDVNTLEKTLAAKSGDYSQARQDVSWRDVHGKLEHGEAVLEFIHFSENFPEHTGKVHYAAMLLRHDAEEPVYISLFEEKHILDILNGDIADVRVQASPGNPDRGAAPIGPSKRQGSDFAALYDLIWKPLESHLDQIQTVFYAPSGILHRISFESMIPSDQIHLADLYQLYRLSSSRNLVVSQSLYTRQNKEVILFGGIHYEPDSIQIHAEVPSKDNNSTSIETTKSLNWAMRGESNRSESWPYLSGTEHEVNSIAELLTGIDFRVKVLKGQGASEEFFKAIASSGKSPRILHLATHGFFFPDPDIHNNSYSKGKQQLAFKLSDHPMIRSGLLLAGSNHAWSTGQALHPGQEDGILTAYEISQMDLSQTELVVLSACETGLGDIQGNQGVYGLQRAFKIAGARYLIMSLWKIPDKQTADIMEAFYRYWHQENQSIRQAFHSAQMEIRAKHPDPFYWAGLVLLE